MAEATRARVRSAIDELGFIRNESARLLRQGGRHDTPSAQDGLRQPGVSIPAPPRPRALGLVMEDFTNPYFADVARGAESAAHAEGMNTIWVTSDGLPYKEERCLDFLAEQHVAGVLITPVALDAERIARLHEHGTALVLVDRELPGVCSVRVDHVAGGYIAVCHLLKHGPRRVAIVTAAPGVPGSGPIRDRLIGAAHALEGTAQDKPAILSEPTLTATSGQAAARRLLALDPRPSAVFCANDLLAIGLVNELLRVGIKIPEEIAVVGYDNIELAATAMVPLTTVHQPGHELGRVATGLLLAETAEFSDPADGEQHEHTQIVLTPELVIRESG